MASGNRKPKLAIYRFGFLGLREFPHEGAESNFLQTNMVLAAYANHSPDCACVTKVGMRNDFQKQKSIINHTIFAARASDA